MSASALVQQLKRQLSHCCLHITRNQQKHQGTATLHDMPWFPVPADFGTACGMNDNDVLECRVGEAGSQRVSMRVLIEHAGGSAAGP